MATHFPDALEAEFRASRANTVAELNRVPFHFGLSAVMVLLFSVWDWFVDPVHWATALAIRCAAVTVILSSGVIARRTTTSRWAMTIAKVRFSSAVLAVAVANAVLDQGYVYGLPGLVAAFLGGPYIVVDRRDYLSTTLMPLSGVALIMALIPLDRFTVVNTAVFLGLTIAVGLMLVRAFEATNRRAFALEQQLQREARTDPLTGLANRRSMEELAVAEFRRQVRSGQPTALILCDVDHFKQVNDEHGHDIGDRTIRAVGEQLRSVLRSTDTVGRWGGEEFLVLLPETGIGDAAALAERMRVTIERAGLPLAHDRPVTISLGVAAVTHDRSLTESARFDVALKQADNALYEAKQRGRNRVVTAAHAETAVPTA